MNRDDETAERYRDVLVLVGPEGGQEARLRLASETAGRFDCRVTGLYAAALPATDHAAGCGHHDVPAHLTMALDDMAMEAGVEAGWDIAVGTPDQVLGRMANRARLADLVVAGQMPSNPSSAYGLVDSAAGPVMFVPADGAPSCVGQRVMVAWDRGREAARAVNDAMPFLRKADTVIVLSVADMGEDEKAAAHDPDIAAYFGAHGIRIDRRQTFAGRAGTGETILSRAAETDADLLVMGAMGRYRPGRTMLGGATRHLLDHMTIPVLMSC